MIRIGAQFPQDQCLSYEICCDSYRLCPGHLLPSNAAIIWSKHGQMRSTSAEAWTMLDDICLNLADIGQHRPSIANILPKSANNLVEVGQVWSNIAHIWSREAQLWPNSANSGKTQPTSGQNLPKLGRDRSHLTEHGPHSAKLSPKLAEVSRTRSKFGRPGIKLDRNPPNTVEQSLVRITCQGLNHILSCMLFTAQSLLLSFVFSALCWHGIFPRDS